MMSTKRRRALWASLNALGLSLALVANGLANSLPLNGMTTGELSDIYPNLFVPAGLTFSIWGLIYLGLLALVVHGFASIRSTQEPGPLEALGPWFLVSCLANGAWILAWHWTLMWLSLAIMLVILGALLAMYRRLGVGVRPASPGERWLVRLPISIYLGWITVATIANITTLVVDMGVPPFGSVQAVLTVVVMAAALVIGAAVLWTRLDLAYVAVLLWAYLGIYLKRSTSTQEGTVMVATGAAVALVLGLLGLIGVTMVRSRTQGWTPGPPLRTSEEE